MGTYSVQEYLDTFGGLPDPGEAYVDPDDLIEAHRLFECAHEDFEIVHPQDAREQGLGAGDAVCHGCGAVRRAADRRQEP